MTGRKPQLAHDIPTIGAAKSMSPPWAWWDFGGQLALVTDGRGSQVILMGGGFRPIETRDPNTGRLQADDTVARYIARACNVHDDLLTALQMALPALEWCQKQWAESPQSGDGVNVLDVVRVAIAKATGGAQ